MKREIVSLRTLNSKVFANGDRSLTLEAHAGHINYLDKNTNEIRPIKNDVIETSGGWEMKEAGYEVELPKKSNQPIKFFVNKFELKKEGLELEHNKKLRCYKNYGSNS